MGRRRITPKRAASAKAEPKVSFAEPVEEPEVSVEEHSVLTEVPVEESTDDRLRAALEKAIISHIPTITGYVLESFTNEIATTQVAPVRNTGDHTRMVIHELADFRQEMKAHMIENKTYMERSEQAALTSMSRLEDVAKEAMTLIIGMEERIGILAGLVEELAREVDPQEEAENNPRETSKDGPSFPGDASQSIPPEATPSEGREPLRMTDFQPPLDPIHFGLPKKGPLNARFSFGSASNRISHQKTRKPPLAHPLVAGNN